MWYGKQFNVLTANTVVFVYMCNLGLKSQNKSKNFIETNSLFYLLKNIIKVSKCSKLNYYIKTDYKIFNPTHKIHLNNWAILGFSNHW